MTLGDLGEFLAAKGLELRVRYHDGHWYAYLLLGRVPAGEGVASGPEDAIVRARVDFFSMRRRS